jgi:transposase
MTTAIETLVLTNCGKPSSRCCPRHHPATAARPGIDDRACLAGIIDQLRTGILAAAAHRQLGCGSPVTCWRRQRDWQRAGVWQQLHHLLLDELGRQGQLDWSRASLDSRSVRADILLGVRAAGRRTHLPQVPEPDAGMRATPVPRTWTVSGCGIPRRERSGWRGLEAGDDACHQAPCRQGPQVVRWRWLRSSTGAGARRGRLPAPRAPLQASIAAGHAAAATTNRCRTTPVAGWPGRYLAVGAWSSPDAWSLPAWACSRCAAW